MNIKQLQMGGGNSLNSKSQYRIVGLDLVRCLAIALVIGGHFFLHSSFFSMAFDWTLFPLGMFQTFIQINVPLFLMLTGYLNINKQISSNYYRGLVRVLVSYLVISIITILVRHFYLHDTHTLVEWLMSITDFSGIMYAWYIEMWIGLFLITPFLGLLWRAIDSKRLHQVLIATMFVLVALPDFFNRYSLHLVPGYWSNMYPVAFFFLGAYVRTYQPSPRRWLWAVVIAFCCINPIATLIMSNWQHLGRPIGSGHGIIGMPLTMLVFMLLYKLDLRSGLLRRLIMRISSLSLDMYLFSAIIDLVVYAFLRPHVESPYLLFVIAVPVVFVTSLLFSWIKNLFPTPFSYK